MKSKEVKPITLDSIIEDMGENADLIDLFGENSSEQAEAIPTGLLGIDNALRIGGIPLGRITELYGLESTGKSTLALRVIAQVNKMGKVGIYFDQENGLVQKYVKANGVIKELFKPIQTVTGEDAFEMIVKFLTLEEVGIIVVDSLAGLVPKKELEEPLDKDQYSAKARMMHKAMRRFLKPLASSKIALIIINQLIDNIGGIGTTTPGGRALKFYSSVRIELKKPSKGIFPETPEGNEVEVYIKKNKLGTPHMTTNQFIRFDHGFDTGYDILSSALELGIVEKSGSWFKYGNVSIGQGFDSAKSFIEVNTDVSTKITQEIINTWKMPLF